MEAIYIILKVSALLAIIILPLARPKRKRKETLSGLSGLSVNEGGFLEPYYPVDPVFVKAH